MKTSAVKNNLISDPPIPSSFEELASSISNSRYGRTGDHKPFYRTLQQLPDGSENIIFISDSMLNVLESCTELQIDSTYKLLPKTPKFHQFLTIHASVNQYSFTVAYVLMMKASTDAYYHIFNYIQTLLPNWSPSSFMTDFEPELQLALLSVFDNIQINGTLFHYSQALHKYISAPECDLVDIYNLGMTDVKNLLRKTLALPLLPSVIAIDGLNVLNKECATLQNKEVKKKVMSFLKYIEDYWYDQIGPEVFSVFGQERRTSDAIKLFHQQFDARVRKGYTKIWKFLGNILKHDMGEKEDYCSFLKGKANRSKAKCIGDLRLIRKYSQKLDKKIMTIERFLDYTLSKVFCEIIPIIVSDQDDDDDEQMYFPTDSQGYEKIDSSMETDSPSHSPVQSYSEAVDNNYNNISNDLSASFIEPTNSLNMQSDSYFPQIPGFNFSFDQPHSAPSSNSNSLPNYLSSTTTPDGHCILNVPLHNNVSISIPLSTETGLQLLQYVTAWTANSKKTKSKQ